MIAVGTLVANDTAAGDLERNRESAVECPQRGFTGEMPLGRWPSRGEAESSGLVDVVRRYRRHWRVMSVELRMFHVKHRINVRIELHFSPIEKVASLNESRDSQGVALDFHRPHRWRVRSMFHVKHRYLTTYVKQS